MITLALLRHAKALKEDGHGDHARSLSASGRTDATAVGEWLRRTLVKPVLVLTSDARRTRETADLAFPAREEAVDIRLEPDLYGASMSDLMATLRGLRSAPTVVLVGHNPGIGEAAHALAAVEPGNALARLGSSYPTATATILQFDEGWADLAPGRGRVLALHVRDADD